MTFSKLPHIDLISSVCHGDSASCPLNRGEVDTCLWVKVTMTHTTNSSFGKVQNQPSIFNSNIQNLVSTKGFIQMSQRELKGICS